ncbi:MAG: multicopper oxidase domain-containing protein [Armatimonadota bacterium]|nr:MAG: multicopper oxidase domain-containing protein [Armatimonadota bacterium]
MAFLWPAALILTGIVLFTWSAPGAFAVPIPGGDLDPTSVPKYVTPLVKPPVMPQAGKIKVTGGKNIDYYEIAVRQFQQQILPATDALGNPTFLPATTVWSYGPADDPRTVAQGGRYFYPAFTIEAKFAKPARVKWINDLVDPVTGDYLPHIIPVDPTLHWANPIGNRDMRPPADPFDPYWGNPLLGADSRYTGPVPMITHVHGAHTFQESDGYPEAWYLPAGSAGVVGVQWTTGTYYDIFAANGVEPWGDGFAVFEYPNDPRATTLWYHDHTLGMTRVNVYAGPAGFYLIRGGPDDMVLDSRKKKPTPAILPGPAPGPGINPFGVFYEIPMAIQDRSFNADGSLFYPDHRAFFEGLNPFPTSPYLDIPFIPDPAVGGPSDVSPIWQPEFFGNVMVVNGQSWPFLDVEPRRYRFRLLNGCNSRFLILQFSDPRVQVWQIGAEGGFLPAPVDISTITGGMLLVGPAERADVIVDFTNVPIGTAVTLLNLGPDEPFGGGVPGIDFDPADPLTTGQVMECRVVPLLSKDDTTPPQFLQLPVITPLVPTATRYISLNEEESQTVFVEELFDGSVVFDPDGDVPFGPTAALLGTFDPGTGLPTPLLWMDPVTENPAVGATETWEIYNFTMDAHPVHIHLVQFQVVDRQFLAFGGSGEVIGFVGAPMPPEAWETGFKDTVIAYPDQVTRVKARFDIAGLYVWHCHIVEHEDNEMMRPYRVGPPPT